MMIQGGNRGPGSKPQEKGIACPPLLMVLKKFLPMLIQVGLVKFGHPLVLGMGIQVGGAQGRFSPFPGLFKSNIIPKPKGMIPLP